MVFMFLNGGAMRDGPLHGKLCGAPFVAETYSTPAYRLYAVADRFPAMDPVTGSTGRRVAGEVYDVALAVLHDSLLPAEPEELELGVIRLVSGAASLAMILRRSWRGHPSLVDISEIGSWRGYQAGAAR
ncbi:MAG TPA: gamma-glutamylcyclotransferase [Actinopolymorphaceae bacterium]|nr:gamma-glutamylcyclotransferase [Actinopolymorphaceae bacterium]